MWSAPEVRGGRAASVIDHDRDGRPATKGPRRTGPRRRAHDALPGGSQSPPTDFRWGPLSVRKRGDGLSRTGRGRRHRDASPPIAPGLRSGAAPPHGVRTVAGGADARSGRITSSSCAQDGSRDALASVPWRTTKPKQPLVPPVPALRYALAVPTVRFQKARHGPQVSSSKTASNGTVRSRVPAPPVQASTCRFATSTTRCTIGALTPRTDGSRVPTVTFTRRSRQQRWRPLPRARRPAPRRPGCRPGPDWVVDRCTPTTAAPPAEDTALRSSRQADGWRRT